MRTNLRLENIIFFSILLTCALSSIVSAQMPNITPAMIEQAKNMPRSQQEALATQLGVIPEFSSSSPGMLTGTESRPLPLNSEGERRLLMEERLNEKPITEELDEEVPIFEMSYEDTQDMPLFGKFLFDSKVSTYAPIDNAPVPEDYLLGIGDSINLLMYGVEYIEQELIVDRSGVINFPELGAISIAGMKFSDVKDYLQERVKKEMIGARISLSMGRLRSINIFMAGAVKVPGNYTVSSLSTISQLLYIAGGVSDIGSLRKIRAIRSGVLISEFDAYDLLTKGHSDGDIRLQSGDVLFVPTISNTATVIGAIRRPGRYEMVEKETLSDLLFYAGGFSERALKNKTLLETYDSNNNLTTVLNVDLNNKLNLSKLVNDGDFLRIARVEGRSSNEISLKGAVKRPGKYAWYEGIKITDIIQGHDSDLSDDSDELKSIIVRRRDKASGNIDVYSFSLAEIISQPDSSDNLLLDQHDEIYVFTKNKIEDMEKEVRENQLNERLSQQLTLRGNALNNTLFSQYEFLGNSVEEELKKSLKPDILPSGDIIFENKKITTFKDASNAVQGLILDEFIDETLEYFEKQNSTQKNSRKTLLEPILDKLKVFADPNELIRIVSISGAVKFPGEYPLTVNATYMDLVELAGGFDENAFLDSVELRRIQINNNGEASIALKDIDYDQLYDKDNFLESRDHINVKRVKDWNNTDRILIRGEVKYPGYYLISRNENLSSVIIRAGGLTEESFPKGAFFARESIKKKERDELVKFGNSMRREQASKNMTKESEDFSMSPEELEASINSILQEDILGRLIIDLPEIINGNQAADLVVQDGDELIIPKYTDSVTVVGEVRRAGSFVIRDNTSFQDAIELAAGMTQRGDAENMYIIRADGSIIKGNKNNIGLFKFAQGDENQVLAGDTIVVPVKTSYQSPLNLYSTVSQVVFQSIASIAAFSTIFN